MANLQGNTSSSVDDTQDPQQGPGSEMVALILKLILSESKHLRAVIH